MKKILLSMLVISAIATAGYLGTKAYFSDIEESKGNVLSAGTIDISVDGQNPWSKTYTDSITDMKPGAHAKAISFVIKNEGQNPVRIWKRITVTDRSTGTVSEPECTDQGGLWDNSALACDWDGKGSLAIDKNDMDSQIVYSMNVNSTELIKEAWDVRISDVDGVWIPVESLEPSTTETITQDYLLDELAGNEYQGDQITFDITLYAEQLMGPGPSGDKYGLVLENKSGDPHWAPVIDGTWGLLTWDIGGVYKLRAWGLDNVLQYKIVYWNGTSELDVDAFASPASGSLVKTGTYAGLNTNPAGAKYWLRDSTYAPLKTLWEANAINY